MEDMIRDIRNLKAALGVLEGDRGQESGRYIEQIKQQIFLGGVCGMNCIYGEKMLCMIKNTICV